MPKKKKLSEGEGIIVVGLKISVLVTSIVVRESDIGDKFLMKMFPDVLKASSGVLTALLDVITPSSPPPPAVTSG